MQHKTIRFHFVLIVLLLIGVFSACKKTEPVDFHYNYFPIQKGRYVIYQVHEEYIDTLVNQHDYFDYFIKAKIGDTVLDNEGRIANKYLRYFSASANGPWNIHDVWTTIRVGNKVELVEENNRLIKLVFAPSKYKEWNCNAYTNLDEMNCYYENIHKPMNTGVYFDSTLKVIQDQSPPTLVSFKNKFEIYAANVGLIYKYNKDYSIYNSDTTKVKKGHFLKMNAVSFGVE